MKLKPIEPGMIIHCDTEEKAKQLINWAFENGFQWYGNSTKRDINWHIYGNQTCYRFMENKKIAYADYKYYRTGIAKFSDLIIPELTVEEVLSVMNEICKENTGKKCCECLLNECTFASLAMRSEEVVKICEQWKADHEKREPEVEWGDICRIIEVQNNGVKKCVYEEDLVSNLDAGEKESVVEGILKQYVTENKGEYIAVVEHICRVKAVE